VYARYRGETFVALLYGATASDAWRFAEAFRGAVAMTTFAGATPAGERVTVSGGVATSPGDGQEDVALVKAADDRMYRAKQAGRNCTVGPERA
jgi:diguanylate cyclase (GGDEF)-like protein